MKKSLAASRETCFKNKYLAAAEMRACVEKLLTEKNPGQIVVWKKVLELRSLKRNIKSAEQDKMVGREPVGGKNERADRPKPEGPQRP